MPILLDYVYIYIYILQNDTRTLQCQESIQLLFLKKKTHTRISLYREFGPGENKFIFKIRIIHNLFGFLSYSRLEYFMVQTSGDVPVIRKKGLNVFSDKSSINTTVVPKVMSNNFL